MKVLKQLKNIYRSEDGSLEGNEGRRSKNRLHISELEFEIKGLKRDLEDLKESSEKDSETAARKVAVLEEVRDSLREENRWLEREGAAVERELEHALRRYDRLEEDNRNIRAGLPTTEETYHVPMNMMEKTQLMISRSREESGGHNENWLLSYSDFMTLVLALFIVLFSLATTDAQNYKIVTSEIQAAFSGGRAAGTMDAPEALAGFVDVPGNKNSMEGTEELDTLKEDIVRTFKKNRLGESLLVAVNKGGLEITLRDNVTFVQGESTLLVSAKTILNPLADILASNRKYDIIVEGHTDDVPISNDKFPSNWELSTSRATTVARYFVDVMGLAPKRFTATGYGEYRPSADNSTTLGRAANRRVVLKLTTKR